MTNEEKAREIAEIYEIYLADEKDVKVACMEMAQWKDEQHKQEKQQWIDKTIKWLEEQDFGGWIESETEDLINDFKQYVKEEQL